MANDNSDKSPSKSLGEMVTEKSGVLNTQHTAEQAADRMRALDTNVLPVAEERKLVGTMTGQYRDREAAAHGHDPKAVRVGEQMSREVFFCYESQSQAEAEKLMRENNLRYLPVVDTEMRIVGMISRSEVEG